MERGRIVKALSGFYYVDSGNGTLTQCRARGRFRKERMSPLVGDWVRFSGSGAQGMVEEIEPRRNSFIRPAVSNLDALVVLASGANPVTDLFSSTASRPLRETRMCRSCCASTRRTSRAGVAHAHLPPCRVPGLSDERGQRRGRCRPARGRARQDRRLHGQFRRRQEQHPELPRLLRGDGRGLGKARPRPPYDAPCRAVPAGGRNLRHRHAGLFLVRHGADGADPEGKPQYAFPDFAPYLGRCRYHDCAHLSEPGCAVLEALAAGELEPTRHTSYTRLYEAAKEIRLWEHKQP